MSDGMSDARDYGLTLSKHGPPLVAGLVDASGQSFLKLPNPTEADLKDPLFNAIWQATKTWDVNAPEFYSGYCGMNGSHVMLILDAIRKAKTP